MNFHVYYSHVKRMYTIEVNIIIYRVHTQLNLLR
jgi:hypothetical protein